MCNTLQQESNRICIYILEYTPHILSVNIVSTSFSFRFWLLKVEEPFISEKIALGITMLETWRKKTKTDENTKRLCETYGRLFTGFYRKTWSNFYRKTIPISKIIRNLKFFTILGSMVGIKVLTQAV